MPASLHASLMARLDRVPGVKEVAQVAACLGREFDYPLLAAVSPVPEPELRAALDRLAAAELVFARGEPPEASYSFKHALVRDAAHESLLKSAAAGAARPHRRGCWRSASRRRRTPSPSCSRGTAPRRASPSGRSTTGSEAGQRALARSAMAEAVAHLTRGAGGAGRPARRRRARSGASSDLQLALGQALDRREGLRGAGDRPRLRPGARAVPASWATPPELFPALYGRFIVHFQRGELAAALEAARELLRLAEERGDAAARVTGHRIVGSALYHLGRLAESRAHLERGLALYEPERDRGSALVYALDLARGLPVLARPRALRAGLSRAGPGADDGRRSPTPASSPTPTRWPTP